MTTTRFKLVSASLGTYVGFVGTAHVWSKQKDPVVVCDFVSNSGAQGMLDIMPAMNPDCPDDITIVPFIHESK